MTLNGFLFDAAQAALAGRLRGILVGVRSREGSGSGTAWAADGLVVTNAHVARGDHATVALPGDGPELPGRIVARDPVRDLAAIRVDATFAEAATTGASHALRPGALVFAAGNPGGHRGVVTAGVVVSGPAPAAAGRASRAAILADLELRPGCSGGPLADAAGRVVGINTMVTGGMAVAVPVEEVVAFLAEVDQPRGFLGIDLLRVAPAVAEGAAEALMVTGVHRGSAAEAAGMLPGDILVSVGGQAGAPVAITDGLQAMLAGRPVVVDLLRGGRAARLVVTPGRRPA